jgi:1-hydroxycarotenoid 3,4-desaturase
MRQTHTVIVVGAGAGGLASAISAAAAGFDVTVVERSNTPGGKMRQLSAGGRPVDAGPTVLTMRWVFEQLFALAGADLGARIGLKQARLLARHGWRDGARLDLFADIEDSARAIADFSDRENAEGYRRFAADSAAMFSTLKPSYINAQRPGPLALVKRIGLFNQGRPACAQAAVLDVVGARLLFFRSAAAAAFRTLRHLLRLVALSWLRPH